MLDPTLADTFNKIADIAALVVFFGMALFTILYSSFYRWQKRKAGKSLLLLAVSFVSVSLVSILALWIGDDFWLRPFWRMLAWLFGVFAVCYLIYALLYNWKDRHPLQVEPREYTDPVVSSSLKGESDDERL
ncbi:membrane protein [Microbacterium phage Shocker]|uniref:Membrane protein n=1 Tax=Microbacterium phage Shocker TaxID=2805839 RepID=A0A890USH4_9CAUD|nr:membrane protein [Microbacterium phage Shocker]QRI45080.1 membrane protein [Microbacterium phage Shocker]